MTQFRVDAGRAGMQVAVSGSANGEEAQTMEPGDVGSAFKLVNTAREIRETAKSHLGRSRSPVRVNNASVTYLKDPERKGKAVVVKYNEEGETGSANIDIIYRHDDEGTGNYSAVTKSMVGTCNFADLPQSTVGDSRLHMHLAGLGLRGVIEYFLQMSPDTANLQAVAVAFSSLVFVSGSFAEVLRDGLFILDNQGVAHTFIQAGFNFNQANRVLSTLGISAENIRVTSKPPDIEVPVSRENQPLLEMSFLNGSQQMMVELSMRARAAHENIILQDGLLNVWNYVVQLSGWED